VTTNVFRGFLGTYRRLPGSGGAFLAAPASARPLAFLRIGLAAVLLVQAFALWGTVDQLFGRLGLVQWTVTEAIAPVGVPRLSWAAAALAPLGLDPAQSLRAVVLVYVLSLVGLLAGWRTRCMAVVAWLTHLALMTSGRSAVYGVDALAHVTLFYFLWLPVNAAASLDRAAGRVSGAPSGKARLGLRVLQLHLCVVYLASGLLKASGDHWWNGEAVWRTLMCRDLARFDFAWLAAVPWLPRLACWGTLLLEIGYAFFVWPRWTRKPLVLGVMGLHVGIAVAMGLWSFSAVMIVLNAGAFLVSPEPCPARVPLASPATAPEWTAA
jgi:hypothetical protein